MGEVDTSGDGSISWEEFETVFKSVPPVCEQRTPRRWREEDTSPGGIQVGSGVGGCSAGSHGQRVTKYRVWKPQALRGGYLNEVGVVRLQHDEIHGAQPAAHRL